MKARVFEKNGLPNPLGMTMIILIIGLVCLVQCILTQPAHAQKKPDVNYLQVKKGPDIQIEEWMVDPGYWNNGALAADLVEEPDPEITIEDWMTDFPMPALASNLGEPEYEVEAWMFDETLWINPESNNCTINETQDECF